MQLNPIDNSTARIFQMIGPGLTDLAGGLGMPGAGARGPARGIADMFPLDVFVPNFPTPPPLQAPPTPPGAAPQGEDSNALNQIATIMQTLIQLLTQLLRGQQGAAAAKGNAVPGVGAAGAAGPAKGEKANPADGPGGFLFKPVSESDGKLVVLLPKQLSGKVDSVVIRDAAGNVIDQGNAKGVANGGREHFRFDKPGNAYPKNVTVEVTMKDGTVKTFQIADPSKRTD